MHRVSDYDSLSEPPLSTDFVSVPMQVSCYSTALVAYLEALLSYSELKLETPTLKP